MSVLLAGAWGLDGEGSYISDLEPIKLTTWSIGMHAIYGLMVLRVILQIMVLKCAKKASEINNWIFLYTFVVELNIFNVWVIYGVRMLTRYPFNNWEKVNEDPAKILIILSSFQIYVATPYLAVSAGICIYILYKVVQRVSQIRSCCCARQARRNLLGELQGIKTRTYRTYAFRVN